MQKENNTYKNNTDQCFELLETFYCTLHLNNFIITSVFEKVIIKKNFKKIQQK